MTREACPEQSRRERARLGGLAVVKRYGKKHMAAIGRKGFDAAIQALRQRSANRSPLAQAEMADG